MVDTGTKAHLLLQACKAALSLIAGETTPDGASVWCEVRDQLAHAIQVAEEKPPPCGMAYHHGDCDCGGDCGDR